MDLHFPFTYFDSLLIPTILEWGTVGSGPKGRSALRLAAIVIDSAMGSDQPHCFPSSVIFTCTEEERRAAWLGELEEIRAARVTITPLFSGIRLSIYDDASREIGTVILDADSMLFRNRVYLLLRLAEAGLKRMTPQKYWTFELPHLSFDGEVGSERPRSSLNAWRQLVVTLREYANKTGVPSEPE